MTSDSLTPKQEKFCQKYIELGNASEAYRLAYDAAGMKSTTVNRNAFALLENSKISARVNELKDRALTRHDITVDSLTIELEEARSLAIDTSQPSAAVSATLGKAKLHGLLTDKSELTGPNGGPIKTESVALVAVAELKGKTPQELARAYADIVNPPK